jgi:broad specificity phosphatase PhoE
VPVAQVLTAIFLASALGGPAVAAEGGVVVIAVRHAETDRGGGTDPGLSDGGRRRAEELARVLADTGISAIYVSDTKRAQETAEPLAKARGLTPTVLPGKDLEGLARAVRATSPGRTVLVVGHSNTVPALVRRLGGDDVAPMADDEYDRMFVVVLSGETRPAVVTALRYGSHE